jgi:site-specific recombinase XerD
MQQKQEIKLSDAIDRASRYLKEEHRLSEYTVKKHRDNWLCILNFAEKQGLLFVNEAVYEQFITHYLEDERPERSMLYSLKLLQEYIRSDRMLSKKEPLVFEGEIGDLMQRYIAEKKSEHLRTSSLHTYRLQLSRFLRYLSESGLLQADAIKVEHILLYIRQLPVEHKSNMYIATSIVKRFLKWLYDSKILNINLSIRIPGGRYVQQSELPAVYTREEIERMLKDGIDRGYSTGKRNYLILLLAARLGLRSSDICNLKFSNVQWEKNLLLIEQVKTGRMLELPLLADVGNAIIDYLRYGRPKSEEQYIFLNAGTPFRKMTPTGITGIALAAFKRAGIDISGRRHGAHALRHSLAARMLEGQTTLPVISEVLGHEKTDSTMYYLRIDLSSLKMCILDVPAVKSGFYEQFKF